jgi:hypothetical protein
MTALISPRTEGDLVAGVVGRLGVDGVAPALGRGGITLHRTAAISAEVVHVGGVGPLGIDGGVVVESALRHHCCQPHAKDTTNGMEFLQRRW